MFIKNVHKRMKIVFFALCFLFILIILKIFYIQVIDYDKLNDYASSLWSRNLPIEPDRGNILTSDGKVIADNITTTSLVLIPNQIKDKEGTAKKISDILGSDYNDMLQHVSKKTSIERVHPEGRRLSYEVADKISALNLKGVYLLRESKRNYPYDKYLSHVLGYVGIDNQGLSGLELEYDDYLTGEFGSIKYFSDAKGQRLKMSEKYEAPQAGINMMLTVNHEIQTVIESELDNIVTKYNPEQALILAVDPNSGEILGMSSRPNFSPTNYSDYSKETINRNLPIWSTYEPGSTFKIITLAATLEEKTIDLEKEDFFDSGSIKVENATIHCWKHGGHGAQTFLEVVENSCNPGFVVMGQKLGAKSLYSYIHKFGFGQKTGIDLNGEENGILFDLKNVGPVELATTAFGQGVSVTPIQQIMAVSSAINGGKLYKPYIVKALLEPETNSVIKKNEPQVVRQTISEQTSKKVRETLESVVSKGTGRNAYIDGYRVGGKTGTAQKVKDGKYLVGNYIVSFMGFAPANDPKIVVYVAIDNPKGITQYGGTVAAPVAKEVLEESLRVLEVEKQDNGIEREYLWSDVKSYRVPNVVGKTKEEATKMLDKFQVKYSGQGNKVISQTPEAKESLKEGGTIRLLLGD